MHRVLLAAVIALFTHAGAASAQPPDLTGKWSGYWLSDRTGHTGPLHGRFRQVDDATYRVTYHGRFAKILPFWYRTTMHVEGSGDGVVLLTASQRLGPFGTFTTTATATGTSFDATYSSRSDTGRFALMRRR
jgi:hypothetical protein